MIVAIVVLIVACAALTGAGIALFRMNTALEARVRQLENINDRRAE